MLETSRHGFTAVSSADSAASWMRSQLGGRAVRRDLGDHTVPEGACILQLGLLP